MKLAYNRKWWRVKNGEEERVLGSFSAAQGGQYFAGKAISCMAQKGTN